MNGKKIDMTVSMYMNKCELTGGSAGKESACNAGDLSLIPGLGRCPGFASLVSIMMIAGGFCMHLYVPCDPG